MSLPAWSLPNGQVSVEYVALEGRGCPSGSVAVQLAPDASSFTLLYDQFQLDARSQSLPEISTECKVIIKLRKPLLLGFAVESMDMRGFIQLDSGVSASQKVTVRSGAVGPIRKLQTDFGYEQWQGPVQQNYLISTLKPLQRPEILNCIPPRKDTKIEIISKLRIKNVGGGRAGLMMVDSADGRMVQKYNLRWTNCLGALGHLLGGFKNR